MGLDHDDMVSLEEGFNIFGKAAMAVIIMARQMKTINWEGGRNFVSGQKGSSISDIFTDGLVDNQGSLIGKVATSDDGWLLDGLRLISNPRFIAG